MDNEVNQQIAEHIDTRAQTFARWWLRCWMESKRFARQVDVWVGVVVNYYFIVLETAMLALHRNSF